MYRRLYVYIICWHWPISLINTYNGMRWSYLKVQFKLSALNRNMKRGRINEQSINALEHSKENIEIYTQFCNIKI